MVIFTCVFVFTTLLLSGLATVILSFSLLSDDWEIISYSAEKAQQIAQTKNHSLQWLSDNLGRIEMDVIENANDSKNKTNKVGYLVPAHGGVHKLCANVTDEGREKMKADGFHHIDNCISYLSNDNIISKDAWLDRMRNLAMSCAIVCLILLSFSAPLGILGLFKKQISTIMVTGVMYILATVFGTFNLAFMHFKRVKPDGYYTSTILDMNLPDEYMKSRIFTSGWPFAAEWAGLCLCLTGSLFWLILAKIYRIQILNPP